MVWAPEEVWEVRQAVEDTVVLSHRIEAGPHYPSDLEVSVTYSLSSHGLHSTVTTVNVGSATPTSWPGRGHWMMNR